MDGAREREREAKTQVELINDVTASYKIVAVREKMNNEIEMVFFTWILKIKLLLNCFGRAF